jgi:tryptophanase
MENLRAVRALCNRFDVPFYLDACRFAENAYFIKEREAGMSEHSIRRIVQEMFSLADGCTMSAKKDGLVNIGGFFATRDPGLAEKVSELLILIEGFTTYGGLAGRDLNAMACGFEEVLEEDYLAFRIGQVRQLGQLLLEAGIPIIRPVGGHAVYIDAARLLPQIPPAEFPGQALACALYLEGGIRSVEIGSLMSGAKGSPLMELVRLAIPHRVYTSAHMTYVADVVRRVHELRHSLCGLRLVKSAPLLRHFTAELEPLEKELCHTV